MQKSTKYTFAALALFAALVVWTLRTPVRPTTASSASGQAQLAAPQVNAPAPAAATQAAAKKSAPPVQREMLEKYNRSQSYRAFLYEALKHPEAGGYHYSIGVLERCRKFTLPFVPNGGNPGQQAAQSQLASRCDMSVQERASAQDQLTAVDQRSTLLNDPLMRLGFEFMTAQSADARSAAIAAILASGDPDLLLTLLHSQVIPGSAAGDGIYFGGHWYPDGADATALYLAYDLAMCELGADCGPASISTLLLCANRGFCGDSTAAAIQNGVAANGATQYASIVTLANLLAAAFRNQDVNAFLAPVT